MMDNQTIIVADNNTFMKKGRKFYKALSTEGNIIKFVEVDLEEYDKKIQALAEKIATYPQVDLLMVLKDALYDLSLKKLERLEKALTKEEQKASENSTQPHISTNARERGTCVNLFVGRRLMLNVRQ